MKQAKINQIKNNIERIRGEIEEVREKYQFLKDNAKHDITKGYWNETMNAEIRFLELGIHFQEEKLKKAGVEA